MFYAICSLNVIHEGRREGMFYFVFSLICMDAHVTM